MPRLTIIQPSHYADEARRRVHKTRKRSLVGLTLPYLAALTPRDWEVDLVDEQLEDVDFDAAADLVAITTWTVNSFRAYELADELRRRGRTVLMGGPHTFFHAEEAAEHADAVGVGEGELIWSDMLSDAAAGRLQPIYRAQGNADLRGLPMPRHDLLDMRRYGRFRTYTVQSSRGCPFSCEFCSERFYIGTSYRYRPAGEVVEEIRASGARNVFFADSMFAGKKHKAMELMEALVPLKIRWSTLWTTYLCLDDEFMDLAAKSGLLHVNMGMESVSQETLGSMNKNFNKVGTYDDVLAGLRKRGISYSLNFVFGSDGESVDVFPRTLRFLQEHRVPTAYFYILNPHRGTPLYERMKKDGRILMEQEMRRRTGNICYIQPDYCSPEELEEHVRGLYRSFYSLGSMLRRLPPPVTKANLASWFLNFSQRRMIQRERRALNFNWA